MNISMLLMLTTILLSTLIACAPTTGTLQAAIAAPTARPNQELLGLWQLDSASQMGTIPSGITLAIRKTDADSDSLHLAGYSGVNDYVSDALVDASQQRFILRTQIATTRKWGTLPRRDFEQAYLDALDGVVSYHAAGRQLTLVTLKGDKLQFNKVDD